MKVRTAFTATDDFVSPLIHETFNSNTSRAEHFDNDRDGRKRTLGKDNGPRRHRNGVSVAARLVSAQEGELKRMAGELHDDVNQRIAALLIDICSLERRLDSHSAMIRQEMSGIRARMQALSDDVRNLSHRLHPSMVEHLGLIPALEAECQSFSKREGIFVDFVLAEPPASIPADIALCLYRIAQECLRNIARHSRAKTAGIILAGSQEGVRLRIRDSGIGFDSGAKRRANGLGLISMRERARMVRGSLCIRSRFGKGTEVEVRVPLERAAEAGKD